MPRSRNATQRDAGYGYGKCHCQHESHGLYLGAIGANSHGAERNDALCAIGTVDDAETLRELIPPLSLEMEKW